MVWLMLARRAVASECYGEALRCFDNALHHDATLAIAHLGRAMSLAQLDREAEAREATEALIENAEGQEEVLYQLARMCAREGRVGFGVALLTQAVLAQPRLEDAAVKDALFADHPAYLQALGRL
jgi:tetratricopeptide (TPR) repeat protein